MNPCDVFVSRHGGNLFLFELMSDKARAWVKENVQEPLYYGGAVAVEPRYAENLWQGMKDEGLVCRTFSALEGSGRFHDEEV